MGTGTNSVAAATAVVGYDLAANTIWQQQSVARALTGFALKGSAAATDTKVSVYVDTVKVGEFWNTGTGFPNMDDLFPLDSNYVPAGAMIHIYVDDAPGTNPINLMITFDEVEEED